MTTFKGINGKYIVTVNGKQHIFGAFEQALNFAFDNKNKR